MLRLALGALAFLGATQTAALEAICTGESWRLTLSGPQAEFVFPAPTTMSVPHTAIAEGAEWPRALTLIGDRDTAIVLIHDRACMGGSHEAQVLTQRGQTPILLQGCCQDVEP